MFSRVRFNARTARATKKKLRFLVGLIRLDKLNPFYLKLPEFSIAQCHFPSKQPYKTLNESTVNTDEFSLCMLKLQITEPIFFNNPLRGIE